MKPANTFSSELVRKVSKKDEYKGLNSDQVLLSILNGPAVWFNTPIIYLKRGNDSIRKLIGVPRKPNMHLWYLFLIKKVIIKFHHNLKRLIELEFLISFKKIL